MKRTLFEDEHEEFRHSFRTFLEREVAPHDREWDAAGIVPHEIYEAAGENGFLCMSVPEEYGGAGVDDFRFNAVQHEELMRLGLTGFGIGVMLHNDVCLPYFLHYTNEEQKQRWLPGMVSGRIVTAIGMTEPGIGSDLGRLATTARRDGEHYVVNGAKTFITNGINADLVMTAVKTDPTQRHRGISLIGIERDTPGFERGRNLEKVGLHGQDTAELFFSDALVPVENLLGEEGKGFGYLVASLAQERLSVAWDAWSSASAGLDWTIEYVKQREAFGQTIADFQTTRHALADCRTEVDVARTFLDRCTVALNDGELTVEEAAQVKLWTTEMQTRVLDRCVQLHGGYGYMVETPIARAWADGRVTRIYAGANEVMKEIIGRAVLA
ncbi:acyl-CoA dehydrogenase family protein [Patulibacter defluvii]|uniref:acyl-CoA dehydrogenase family protein n=1 Tax=Patulibacter defluvii TaxID=3095358 RepID=UPI002A76208C|nr:acyl-CoA dehydrogenase family protein [Patulibacter sp. DM4]